MSLDADYRLLTSRPYHLAQLLAGALRAEGIDAVVERDVLATVYALDSGRHATHVYVAAAQVDAARAWMADVEEDGTPPA